jgi:protein-S-isoprenylcysteine O-methyltransferase Ste14
MCTHPAIAAAAVIGFALFVLWRVRSDYARRGKLPWPTALLQFAMFLLHGLASYSFLDSRLSTVYMGGLPLPPGLAPMACGALLAVEGVQRLRWGDTVGTAVSELQRSGVYRVTRNPQLLAYLLFLVGYMLLWPSWRGLVWLALYGAVAHLMVLTEERHLRRVFGEVYETYCRQTPRYLGIPRRSSYL